jgi:hypothetical protein
VPILQIGQRPAKGIGLIGRHPFDEMHQCGVPITGIGGLIQGVDHQTGDEFIASVGGCIPVRAVITDLFDKTLAGQPL